jgi:glycosyltransferase involved in cell wall biosynthesis
MKKQEEAGNEGQVPVIQKDLWQEKLAIVIPAFNEQGGIARTLASLQKSLPDAEIIVVDDGSTDKTADIVSMHHRVKLIQHTVNRGYGAGLKTGMRSSTREYVAWFDADNEHNEEDLCRLVDRLHSENLVAVIGERPNRGASLTRNIGKLIITYIGRTLKLGIRNDLNCGLRVFRKDVILRYLPLLPDGYSASMTSMIVMLERGYPTAFEPITTKPRIGTSKVKLTDGFRTIISLIRMVMLFAPMRIFLGIGSVLIGVGIGYSVLLAVFFGRGIPTLGAVAITVGFLISMLGLLADQISQLRLSILDAETGTVTRDNKHDAC